MSRATAVSPWPLILCAAAILMITMGARQSLGLFISPLNTATGLGITAISFAMAVAQFVWGAAQPIAGAVADRYGPGRVLAFGVIVTAIGFALTPLMASEWGLVFTIGLLSAAGSGAGSFSVLIGAAAQRLGPQSRGMAAGVINAGGSFGQFVFAPLLQRLISGLGWVGAMFSLAVITLMALPFARALRGRASPQELAAHHVEPPAHNMDKGLRVALRHAMADRSYLLLHAGFFTCGFHIAFLVTHLPGEVQLCGLPAQVASWSLAIIGLSNLAGSLAAGWAVQRYRSKYVLAWMYGSRAVLVALYLMAPKTAMTFYVFAVGLGFTWLATVPPTAGVVGKLFGTRYLGTLFGLTLLSHQIGGFLGAWLGGFAVTRTGDYTWMWYADMALAAAAAACNLPIREAPMKRGVQLA
ncbi:MFS transporter [Cognatazoarcus halotolerans]|uniref:MFS transporter n=1 Tax=Cognatazoarcus halotolerans TaxID=2686016 RepID=UPI00135B380E|nr:MFS transporter [Cognatazoarcus halotolerans]MBX3679685.1 MFS transporter [Rhodocyclaceae bacterium]MCB1901539.1 MFS transporter [Rhodocyclaceae bacterium]MCP5307943.1 MFS transporter [Zoogloeaceae bacterium]